MKYPDLQEYAMAYLARYNNTEKGLIRVLKAKLRRWALKSEQEGIDQSKIDNGIQQGLQQIPQIIAKVKKIGIVDDCSYTEYKMNSLIRSGRSQKAIQNKLLQKGVAFEVIQSVLGQYQDQDTELLAALVYARKRRIGPFRRVDREVTHESKQKEQSSFARGGFSFVMVDKVLSMELAEAEETIQRLRSL
ncbi:regulatory protein RecX [Commensalibacter nepenthis]|uniref:RecX family transcriptional regulator n=1 Tax=Commensalibacter nepenthis TaxID=3043872 RepID=A0ABT6Q5V4_9PROT|nr:RecX family transcriptional regulator [Commensalibacter sp. TBRC 10068]MDI2112279.1 RecX family transcriptional regulator [Commensalibacter sp. TBRC 10068]